MVPFVNMVPAIMPGFGATAPVFYAAVTRGIDGRNRMNHKVGDSIVDRRGVTYRVGIGGMLFNPAKALKRYLRSIA